MAVEQVLAERVLREHVRVIVGEADQAGVAAGDRPADGGPFAARRMLRAAAALAHCKAPASTISVKTPASRARLREAGIGGGAS